MNTPKEHLIELSKIVLYKIADEDYLDALDWAIELSKKLAIIARDNAKK